jgi:hypothetical protein
VFERDRVARDIENENAEGAVVVLPAVINFQVIPAEMLDGRFDGLLGEGMGGIIGEQLNFVIGREWDPFVAGVPRLDILDLAGISAAVVTDGYAVNSGFIERGKKNFLVAGAAVIGGRVGLGFGSVGMAFSLRVFVLRIDGGA